MVNTSENVIGFINKLYKMLEPLENNFSSSLGEGFYWNILETIEDENKTI